MRFDAFLHYMNKREAIRRAKEEGVPQEHWTDDPILQEYKFTNIRREHDRTSKWLINNWYRPNADQDVREILLNAAIARWTGTIEFCEAIGWSNPHDIDWYHIRHVATERLANGQKVFTGAYVITNSGHTGPKIDYVLDYVLIPLRDWIMRHTNYLFHVDKWKDLCGELRALEGFGGSGFMAKEVVCDTTYTNFWGDPIDGFFSYPEDWRSWTPVGPGARRGAARYCNPLDEDIIQNGIIPLNEARTRHVIREIQSKLALTNQFNDLSAHDVQFVLCEFDKYERVRLGQGRPRSKYRRTTK
jgi:hypothetical protein